MKMRYLLACITCAASTGAIAKKVEITSTPPGAEVVVDGRVLGVTPLQTSRKDIMPHWTTDGVITRATLTIRLPMYVSYSTSFGEWSVPKQIDAVLERDAKALHFENYLESVEGLEQRTQPADKSSLYVSDDLDVDSAALEARGYLMVGYIGASSSIVPLDIIRERAAELQAAVVLVRSADGGVQTEIRAVTSTTSGGIRTTLSNGTVSGQANAYALGPRGSGTASIYGSATASGSAVTFTPAQVSTSWVPYATRQYSTQASVWRKRKGNGHGLALDVLPVAMREQLQRNSGAYVAGVEESSAAFVSDLLVGDVIIEAAGAPVRRPAELEALLKTSGGQAVPIVVLRKGERVELELLDTQVGRTSG